MGKNRRGGGHRSRGGGTRKATDPQGDRLGQSSVPPPRDSNVNLSTHFSLQQEARNTERHHSWNSDLRLRHTQVEFISAGPPALDQDESPLKMQCNVQHTSERKATPAVSPAVIMAQMSLDEESTMEKASVTSHLAKPGHFEPLQSQRDGQKEDEPVTLNDGLFFVDTNGTGQRPRTGLQPPKIRRASLSVGSDSSEEIILFKGRNRSQDQTRPRFPTALEYHSKHGNRKEEASRMLEQAYSTRTTFTTIEDSITKDSPVLVGQAGERSIAPPVPNSPLDAKTRRREKRVGSRRQEVKEREEEILNDYIENIKGSQDIGDSGATGVVNGRELGGIDTDEWQDETRDSAVERQLSAMLGNSTGWDSDNMHDLDELSTSGEVLGFIETIISKRERPSGLQYLVIWEGYTIDDARWVPSTSLTMYGADEHIRQYEAEQEVLGQLGLQSDGFADSSTDDDQIVQDLKEDLEDLKDERDLWDRRIARMTDEQIARILGKQEELGLGSDELVLLDGNGDTQTTEDSNLGAHSISRRVYVKEKKKKKGSRYSLNVPKPKAAYDGFDIVDHDRPSLLHNTNGRHATIPFDLFDTDLEETLQSAWADDRKKKKARKQEREELRAQGLLTKKNKPILKARYGEGMTLNEVKNEISDFLVSSAESLPLPPMDQKDRKMVHEIAHVFNIRSKSVGSGKSRFPVLYKTSRTTLYSEDAIIDIDARLSQRRFFPRMDKKGKRGPRVARNARSGGIAGAAVSYQDGEIVGAAAPELGIENKGRAMLERMGWSTGTALGALNNKGITQPISHTVKTTRAGLG